MSYERCKVVPYKTNRPRFVVWVVTSRNVELVIQICETNFMHFLIISSWKCLPDWNQRWATSPQSELSPTNLQSTSLYEPSRTEWTTLWQDCDTEMEGEHRGLGRRMQGGRGQNGGRGRRQVHTQLPEEIRTTVVDHVVNQPHKGWGCVKGATNCWENFCKFYYSNISLGEQVHALEFGTGRFRWQLCVRALKKCKIKSGIFLCRNRIRVPSWTITTSAEKNYTTKTRWNKQCRRSSGCCQTQ